MAGQIKRKLRETYQTRIPTFSGQVTSVGIGADGRSLGYILCNIGGSTLKVYCGPLDNYQPGDWVTVEQRGGAASAGYYAMGFISGVRSSSQILEVPSDTTINGVLYERGDLILGDPGAKFWHYDASQGAWLMQDTTALRGAIGNLDGLYGYSGTIYGTVFGTASGSYITIDETNGIRQYGGGTQRSWFKQDGSGWLGGSDKIFWDAAGNLSVTGKLTTGPNSVVDGQYLVVESVTAGKIKVDNLQALSADMGSLTAGSIVIGTTNKLWLNDSGDGGLAIGGTNKAAAPFRVTAAGALTATNATITGAITASSGAIGGWTIGETLLYAGSGANRVGLAPGTYPFYAGSETAASAPFRVTTAGALTAASATITGAINATSGTFSNTVQVGTDTVHLHLTGTAAAATTVIETSDFVSGTSGWRISGDGDAEMNNVTLRGAIRAAVFQKSLVTAFAGSQVVSKSASTVAEAVTLSATTFPLVVKAQDGAPFADGDLIYIKTETLATYAIVNAGTASGDNWAYTATYHSGSNSGTVPVGATVVDYGPNGTGRLLLTADQSYAPYLSIATHDMAATPVWTERVRLGNLDGISGASGYGLWTDNGFFTGTVDANAGHIGTLDVDGILTLATGGELRQGTVTSGSLTDAWPLTGFTGLRIWNESGVGRIAGYNSGSASPQWYAGTDGKLYAGGGSVVLDAGGLKFFAAISSNHLRFFDAYNAMQARIYTYDFVGDTEFVIQALAVSSGGDSQLELSAKKYDGATGPAIYLIADGAPKINLNPGSQDCDTVIEGDTDVNLVYVDASADKVGIGTNTPAEKLHVAGNIRYTGDLKPYRNSTAHTGYVFVPLTTMAQHASYDGDAINVGTYTLNLQDADWGLPAGIKAVAVRMSVKWGAAADGNYALLHPKGGSYGGVVCRAHVANIYCDSSGIVPCDAADGDIDLVIGGANATAVFIEVWGYFI